jgi:hypothetical protein
MATHRETYFTCTYASRDTRRTAVVPAWDAHMAEALFRDLLAEEPVEAGGVIEVQEPGGKLACRAAFQPGPACS